MLYYINIILKPLKLSVSDISGGLLLLSYIKTCQLCWHLYCNYDTLHGIIMSVIITTGILMTGKNMTYFLKTVKFIPVMFIHRHFITCWNTFWWIDDSFMYTKFEVLFFSPWNLLHFLIFNIIYRLMKHNIMYIQSF